MFSLLKTIFFDPLFNVLVVLYNTVALEDLGLAIIFLTIIIRIILFPLFHKGARHQKQLQTLQPKLKKVQEAHKDDRAKQAEAMMALYKEHNISPFSGFFILLVQLPILIVLYQVFIRILKPGALELWNFVVAPEVINYTFLGLINLTKSNILIAGLAALLQYLQGKMTLPKLEKGKNLSPMERVSRNMVFFGPVITIVILANLPAALGLYWLTSSVFSLGQQYIINLKDKKQDEKDGKLGKSDQKNN